MQIGGVTEVRLSDLRKLVGQLTVEPTNFLPKFNNYLSKTLEGSTHESKRINMVGH